MSGSRWDADADEVRDARPYDFEGAKRAVARQSRDQTAAEAWIQDAYRGFAEKERAYRVALAKRIVELNAGGAAWTVCQDLARGDEAVAKLRYERDVAEGVREAAGQNGWKCSANRKSLDKLVDWSMRIDPLGEAQPDKAES